MASDKPTKAPSTGNTTTTTASPGTKAARAECTLNPIDLYSPAEFDALTRQRIACGWNHQPAVLLEWRSQIDSGLKSLFWIATTDDPRAGHISLDSVADDGDPELARADRRVMTVATFFIKQQHRKRGVGGAAMDAVEDMATKEPYGSKECREIALTTLSRKYTEDDSDEWGGMWERWGSKRPPKGTSNEDWYTRRGYVKWKEAPKYEHTMVNGEETKLVAVYLRKELR